MWVRRAYFESKHLKGQLGPPWWTKKCDIFVPWVTKKCDVFVPWVTKKGHVFVYYRRCLFVSLSQKNELLIQADRQRRGASRWEHPKKVSAWKVSWPHDPARYGLAGCGPALALCFQIIKIEVYCEFGLSVWHFSGINWRAYFECFQIIEIQNLASLDCLCGFSPA